MNLNKICFICNVYEEVKYEESLKYIKSLNIPDGFELEIIKIDKNPNIAITYNQAMSSTNAKYKIYTEESTFIIDKNFLVDLINLFNSNKSIGMIGAIGAKEIPTSLNWVDSNYKIGSVYTHREEKLELIDFSSNLALFEQAAILDSSVLATQYDIPFCEDHFDYNLSQSFKFIESGYKIGVMLKEHPFIILDRKLRKGIDSTGSVVPFSINNRIDIENNNELPLVSILIPTYNRPNYFELALQSALAQTYENIEIVIGDDSTNNLTELLVKENYLPYYNHIRYIKNEKNLGQFENDLKLMELANGEYINFLMDDDLFHPEKIEKMMSYYLKDTEEEIALVTSHRRFINENGGLLKEEGVTQKLFNEDTMMVGKEFGNMLLKYNFNFIGEPTTVLFRKKDLTEPFGTFAGRKYGCNVDSATWLTLLSKGKGVYISDTLSYFRIHGNQQLQTDKMITLGAADYAHEVLTAPSYGFLSDINEYREAVLNCINYLKKVISNTIKKRSNCSLEEVKKYLLKLEIIHQVYSDQRNIKEKEQNNVDTQLNKNHRRSNSLKSMIYSKESEEYYTKYYLTEDTKKTIEGEYPLVSILIPAYNRPKYLEKALQSVLKQTYPNIEIIICDDSSNNDVQTMIQPYLKFYNNIRYYRNEVRLKNRNVDKCLQLAQGEYINFLLDDDCFYPQKINKMVEVFLRSNDIKLVTSYRTAIDEAGNKIKDSNQIPSKIFKENVMVNGKDFIKLALLNINNFIGELTTAMFRKKDVPEGIALFDGYEYQNIQDLALWVHLLSQGKGVYLEEPLSYYRIHNEQNAKKPEIIAHSIKEWEMLINYAYRHRFLSKKEYFQALVNYIRVTLNQLEHLFNQGIQFDPKINQNIKKAIDESICKITKISLTLA